MAGLRRARVPVFLEREAMPAWVRSPITRIGGVAVAVVGAAAHLAGVAPDAALVALVGLAPELSVHLQTLARRAVLAATQAGERA
jgi:hypothetical protein